MENNKKVVIIGAGPAGLSAAYHILKNSEIKPIIVEASEFIGGISRTHNYKNNRMDIGGHRFFTKSEEVMDFWKEIFALQGKPSIDEILLDETDKNYEAGGADPEKEEKLFLKRRRISRIYFLKKFFDYPISFKAETFLNMGLKNVFFAGMSYIFSAVHKREEKSLEDFYINRFGKALYSMFFEKYTEKVWGIHPSEISPDWGSQRVKGLSILNLIKHCIMKPFNGNKNVETSLIEEFWYPKFGPGQLYETIAEKITDMGGKIFFNNVVTDVVFDGDKITAIKTKDKDGNINTFECDYLMSSMPIKDLIAAFKRDVPNEVKSVAENLPYRDFITAGLLVKKLAVKNTSKYKTVGGIIPDCWIYIQEHDVKLGRLQIFNNWSPYMVDDLKNTVWLGLEYFCNEGDEMWNMKEEDFIKLASSEIVKIGLVKADDILDSTLIKVKKAYPAYFGVYKDFESVKNYLNGINNLLCIGRNGQHRYNNMDHSILTGIKAAEVIQNKASKDDVWNVNTETEYHEQK